MMSKDWKRFEEAVATFLLALEPRAKVNHNQFIKDIDTGRPRQRDVWVETSLGNHLKINILVSCKRKNAKLNQQDLDAFMGELRSSGAHKGVLYSYSGFTKGALEKAKKLGVSCCLLLENIINLPPTLSFTHYLYRERIRLVLNSIDDYDYIDWQSVLDAAVVGSARDYHARDILLEKFNSMKNHVEDNIVSARPPVRSAEAEIKLDGRRAQVGVESCWGVFRGKTEFCLVNGSYSLTDESFSWSMIGPVVDTLSSHPGPGWEEIKIEDVEATGNISSIFMHGQLTDAALRGFV